MIDGNATSLGAVGRAEGQNTNSNQPHDIPAVPATSSPVNLWDPWKPYENNVEIQLLRAIGDSLTNRMRELEEAGTSLEVIIPILHAKRALHRGITAIINGIVGAS